MLLGDSKYGNRLPHGTRLCQQVSNSDVMTPPCYLQTIRSPSKVLLFFSDLFAPHAMCDPLVFYGVGVFYTFFAF